MHRLSSTYFHAFHQYYGLSHTNAFHVVINLILELFLPRLDITEHLTKRISNKYKFKNIYDQKVAKHSSFIAFSGTLLISWQRQSPLAVDYFCIQLYDPPPVPQKTNGQLLIFVVLQIK